MKTKILQKSNEIEKCEKDKIDILNTENIILDTVEQVKNINFNKSDNYKKLVIQLDELVKEKEHELIKENEEINKKNIKYVTLILFGFLLLYFLYLFLNEIVDNFIDILISEQTKYFEEDYYLELYKNY